MAKAKEIDIVDFACGTDSFKGTLYGPEEYLSEKQKPLRRMNHEEYLNYEKKVDESEGFDVDDCTGCMTGRIVPLPEGCRDWEEANLVAQHAGRKQGEVMGKTIEFVRLLKANRQIVAGYMYYLTFVATDDDKTEKTYRAKVWRRPVTWECKLVLFYDGAHGKNDITVFKTDKKESGKRKRRQIVKEEDYITFRLRDYFDKPEPVESPVYKTICPTSEQLEKDCCDLLAKELKKQYPEWTDAQALRAATNRWKVIGYPEKAPFYKEAWKMFKRRYPQYYSNVD